jgi:hypothetical protein
MHPSDYRYCATVGFKSPSHFVEAFSDGSNHAGPVPQAATRRSAGRRKLHSPKVSSSPITTSFQTLREVTGATDNVTLPREPGWKSSYVPHGKRPIYGC